MKVSFFHRPKAKKFKYNPRYYSKEKEESENRKKRIMKEIENEEKGIKNVKSEIHDKWKRIDRDKMRQKSIRRAIIYILLLLMILYLMFRKF